VHLDIRTLIFVLGITHFIQLILFSYHFRTNREYRGIGWWLMWCAAEMAGFTSMLLRDIPSIERPAIICQNVMLISGVIFQYIGIMRFCGKRENRAAAVSIFLIFLFIFLYFMVVRDDIDARGAVIAAALAAVSFLSAHALFYHKPRSIAFSANFTAALFLMHGCFFSLRAGLMLTGARGNMYLPTAFNVAAYLDGLIFSILWTFVFIAMINQRLNQGMKEAKEEMELVFNTSPDAAVITRLGDGGIVHVNEGFSVLSGFTRREAVGSSTHDINLWKDGRVRQEMIDALVMKGSVDNFEADFRRKDGSTLTGLISAKVFSLQNVPHVISITRDITPLKMAEEALRSSLREKELLLREIHHRVKNNFSVLSGILSLQAGYVHDMNVKEALTECRNRIRSMALVHTRLYQSANLSRIDVRDYITRLLSDLSHSYSVMSEGASVVTDIEAVSLDIDTTIPLGLIVNELVTNALKHAFPEGGTGEVTVRLYSSNGSSVLTVADNGAGLPEGFDAGRTESLGMLLVNALTDQLDGTLEWSTGKGTEWKMTFPVRA